MSIFYISAFDGADLTKRALEEKSLPHIQAHDNQWVVSYKGTSKELSDLIGISTSNGQAGIVVTMSGYYGLAPNDIWEFIAAHWNE